MGVEPTRDSLTAPPGFEVRTPHRGRLSSIGRGRTERVHASGLHAPKIAEAQGRAVAVEEVHEPDGAGRRHESGTRRSPLLPGRAPLPGPPCPRRFARTPEKPGHRPTPCPPGPRGPPPPRPPSGPRPPDRPRRAPPARAGCRAGAGWRCVRAFAASRRRRRRPPTGRKRCHSRRPAGCGRGARARARRWSRRRARPGRDGRSRGRR